MATNSQGRIEITDLDFDTVKSNFKSFLSQQTQFSDYNFEGSGMSVLMDLLAYNTHYLAFHSNMLANDMFIDSAVTRASAVSHAKALVYTPSSMKASYATITVTVTGVPTSQTSLTMAAGTSFNTKVNDVSYQFVTVEDVTATSDSGIFQFPNVIVYEGTWVSYRYVVDTSNLEQQFIIPSASVDTSTLRVNVQTSVSNTTKTTYALKTDFTSLDSNSTTYFLQEVEQGKFEVY